MKKIFLLGLVFLFASIGIVSATNHTSISFTDPGITPDNLFYTFELIYENIQLAFTGDIYGKLTLESQYTAERLAEMNAMIEQQNYDAAQKSATRLNSLLESTETHIGEIGDTRQLIELAEFTEGTTFLNDFLEIQHKFIENSENAKAIKETLLTNVEEGNVDEETAALIINDVQRGITGVETTIIKQKEDLIEKVAETNDISYTEVKITFEEKEYDMGTQEIISGEVTEEELIALGTAIAKVSQEIANTAAEGKENEARAMKILLAQAKLSLQVAKDAFANGDTWKAYGKFTAAEHLTLSADKISGKMFSDLTEKEISEIKLGLGEEGQDIREEIGRVLSREVEDWEKYKDNILEKYPERRAEFERMYEQNKKIMELGDKLKEQMGDEYNSLKAEGLTDEEAAVKVAEIMSDEYRKAYGEDFIPPGFVDTGGEATEGTGDLPEKGSAIVDEDFISRYTPIEEVDEDFFDRYDEGGGFVKNNVYTDPSTGYQYIYRDDGYSYTTTSGQTYAVKYPGNYKPPTYSRGDEVYGYSYATSDGTYTYKYTSTGYEIKNPGGTTEAFTYPQGKYEVVGGGRIEQKSTGFEYIPQKGSKVTYDYNPEYKHYVASDGKVYIPPEGTSYHSQHTNYDSTGKSYSYSHAGESWSYNPDSRIWTSSGGETYKPSAVTGAPVGYEGQKTYTTQSGETWNYDSSSGAWKSSSGKEYTPPPSSYYSYDSKEGHYVDAYGNTHKSSGYTDYSGKTWNYDSSKGTWSSSGGETYNPYTGTTTDSSGQTTNTYNSGGYYSSGAYASGGGYTDASGASWAQNADGSWTSSTGESYSAPAEGYGACCSTISPSGETYYYPGGSGEYDSSGGYVGGDYGGYDSSGNYVGGTYSSGGETGSYSDGDTGGSAPSGGDGGGSTGFTISGFAVKKYRLI